MLSKHFNNDEPDVVEGGQTSYAHSVQTRPNLGNGLPDQTGDNRRRSVRQRSVSGLQRRRFSGKRKDTFGEAEVDQGGNVGSIGGGIGGTGGNEGESRRERSHSILNLQIPNEAVNFITSPSHGSSSSATPMSITNLDLSRLETPKSTKVSLGEIPSSLSMAAAPGTTDAKRLEELAFKLSSETWFNILSKPGHLRTNEELNYLVNWCKTVSRDVTKDDNEAFFQTLEDPVLRQLVKYFNIELAPKLTYVFHEGEVGDTYYLILRGRVGLYVKQQHQALDKLKLKPSRSSSNLLSRKNMGDVLANDQSDGDGIGLMRRERGSFSSSHPDFVRELEQGQEFGERALALDVLRGASVRTLEDCVFLTLDRTRYKIALKFLQEDQSSPPSRAFKEKFVRSTYPLTLLPPNRRSAVVYQLKYEQFKQGEIIYQSGELSERVYFVIEGEVDVMRRVLLPASDEYANFFNVINLSGDGDLAQDDYNPSDADSDSEMPIPTSRLSNIDVRAYENSMPANNSTRGAEIPMGDNRNSDDFEEILALVQGKAERKGRKTQAPRAYLQSQSGANDDWHKLLQATESASESDASHSSVTLTTDKSQIEMASASSGLGPALPLLASAAAITARQKAQREAELAWMNRRYAVSKAPKFRKGSGSTKINMNGFLDPNSVRPLGMPTPKCFMFAGGKVIGSPLLGYHRVPKPAAILSVVKRKVDNLANNSMALNAIRNRSHLPGSDNTLELEIVLGRIGILESSLLRSLPEHEEDKNTSKEADGCLFGHEEGVLPLSALFPPRGVVFVDRPITEPDCMASISPDEFGFWPEQRILSSRVSSILTKQKLTHHKNKVSKDSSSTGNHKDFSRRSTSISMGEKYPLLSEITPSNSNRSTPIQLLRKLTPRMEISSPLFSYNPPSTTSQLSGSQRLGEIYPRSTRSKKTKKFTFDNVPNDGIPSIYDDDSDETEENEDKQEEDEISTGIVPPGVRINPNALSLLPPAGLSGMSLALTLSGYDAIQSNSSSGLGIQIRERKEGLPNVPIPVRSSSNAFQTAMSLGEASYGHDSSPHSARERMNVRTGGVWSRRVARADITKNAAGELVKALKPSPLDCILEDKKKITSPRRHFTVYAASRTVHVYSIPLSDFLKYFDKTRRLLIRAAAFDRLNLYHSSLVKIAGEPASDFATFASEETQRQIKARHEHTQTLSAKESRSLHLSHMKAMKELQDRDSRMIAALKRILAPSSQTSSMENSKGNSPSADNPKPSNSPKYSPKGGIPSVNSPRSRSTFSPSQQTSVIDQIFRRSEYLARKEPLPSVEEDEQFASEKPGPDFDMYDKPTTLGGSSWLPSLAGKDKSNFKKRHATLEFGGNSKGKVTSPSSDSISSKLMSFSANVTTSRSSITEPYSHSDTVLADDKTYINSKDKLDEADITAEQARAAVSILRSASRASRDSKDDNVTRRDVGVSLSSKIHGIKLADTSNSSGRRKSIIHGSLNSVDADAANLYESRYLNQINIEGANPGVKESLSDTSFIRSASPDQRPIPILDTSKSTVAAMIVAVSQQNSSARRKSLSNSLSISPPSSPRASINRRSNAEFASNSSIPSFPKPVEESKLRSYSKKTGNRRGSQPDVNSTKSAKLPTLTQARIVAAAAASLVSRLTKSMNMDKTDSQFSEDSRENVGQFEDSISHTYIHEREFNFESEHTQEDEKIAKLFEVPEVDSTMQYSNANQPQAVSRYLLELAEEEKKWNEEEKNKRLVEEDSRRKSQLAAIRSKGKIAVSNKFDLLAAVSTSGERFPLTGASGTHVPLERIAARVAGSRDAYSLSIEERQNNLDIMIRDLTSSKEASSTTL